MAIVSTVGYIMGCVHLLLTQGHFFSKEIENDENNVWYFFERVPAIIIFFNVFYI